jgi:transcriptional regulator GlxA family with amidase domain
MAQIRSGEETQRVGFLLVPRFSMIALTAALEPLRTANQIAGRPLYEWHLMSPDGQPVGASNGVALIPHGGLADRESFDIVMVVAGTEPQKGRDERVIAWLRRMAVTGARIGGISTGSYHLAWAGLLDGYRCTIHWEYLGAFTETFPELDVTTRLFEVDRKRFTSAGGTAPLDLALHLIGERHGAALATEVAEQFVHAQPRQAQTPQRMDLRQRLGVSHPKLLAAIATIEKTLAEPVSRSDLARGVGLSARQLERLFRLYLGRTPSQYYLEARLKHAQALLGQTSLPVLEVAIACGFASASHFAKCYRAQFGHSPRSERAPRIESPEAILARRRAW